ncbi:MAG TPA: adenylate/guanylate cyclase domain-containing protein, partial [Geminicoccaceae bacterium]|nr:adenylate/guanylate cyclase domain-containing protein [Geminicoccaceae bacterium]
MRLYGAAGASRAELTTRLRLASGLVLLTYVTSHLINHALGIVSLAAMERCLALFSAVWRSLPGGVLLYGALLTHVGLALERLWRRRSLKMPAWEALQILLGLLIPFWLVVHVIGTRGLYQLAGVDDSYAYVLAVLWPGGAVRQSLLLLLVWLHGCIGLHFWLRLRPWYRRVQPVLLAVAVLLPTLALIGFANGGRELRATVAADRGWLQARIRSEHWPDQATAAWVYDAEHQVLIGLTALLLATFAARGVRALAVRRRGRVRVRYPDGSVVAIGAGTSLLEASRAAGIPHAAVCGGRGRCSTCRIRVTQGVEDLPPPAPGETRVLARIGATPGVRLACQLRPTHDVAVIPLLPASAGPGDGRLRLSPGQGVERELAVLFADLRGFTRMAEGRLPYDVVFVLNQYFKAMGETIERQGGRIDKFIGDGIMALYGLEGGSGDACLQALATARAMSGALARLNRRLVDDLREPLRIGIGLHVGPVIVGQMGYGRATTLTAIGDTVNVASRLEALTKELEVELVVSSRLAEAAAVDLGAFEERRIEIRG